MEEKDKTEDVSLPSVSATVHSNENPREQSNELVEVPNAELEENHISIENLKEEHGEKPLRWRAIEWSKIYAKKFRGLHEQRPKRLPWSEYLWSLIGAFLGIAAVAFLHFRVLDKVDLSFIIDSFGASAVLLFGTPRSPLAQPRHLLGGHVISAICGCTIRVAIERFETSVACALAVSLSIVLMQMTETLHPPGGATALIAVTSRPLLPAAHFLFILMPVLTGALTMLIVALVVNNLASKRTYPAFWW